VFNIDAPNKLQGFILNGLAKDDGTYIMCCIENKWNIIDTTRLYIWYRDNIKAEDLEFYQYRETYKRNIENDPVIKYRVSI
jgi:hypothetical protein